MADMLRTLRENAFDIEHISAEEIAEYSATWAQHLLIGIPPPDRESPASQGEDVAPESAKRSLPRLRRALSKHRVAESDYVTDALGSFREAAWPFVSVLRRSLTAEQTADRRIDHRMRRLEGAVRTGEANKITNEAQETVTLLTEFLAERGGRHHDNHGGPCGDPVLREFADTLTRGFMRKYDFVARYGGEE